MSGVQKSFEAKRGSRVWFEKKLNAIEALGGTVAREAAACAWAKNVWSNRAEAGYAGADCIEKIYRLCEISAQLKDTTAKNKIIQIIQNGDETEMSLILEKLSDQKLKDALRAQGVNEESIRRLARSNADDYNHEKRIRRDLRSQAKQATAFLNMTLGLIGSNGHKHASPYEVDLRNQQKQRWVEFGNKTQIQRGDESLSMASIMKAAGHKKFAEVYTLSHYCPVDFKFISL
ncbi:hypothetical protein [Gallionella capsiferriformans]|uniref:Uncharacterized protein n=1 Tax=Gallionella capsiferriformans (strain ES-2) TaxID=395494 RepID=D9SII3_GALCS|nr:hypothetical protein [Gallionella capsiferriformans]ADL56147.1 hypothetical protein Galf_2142 [Gallionella capsiferriformans ES-2]